MGVYTEAVQKLYVAYFSRPADAAGLAYWENVVTAAKGNTAAVSAAFAASQEYKDTFAGQSAYQVINTIYQNLFGRPAEAAALTFWGQGLLNGAFTIDNAVTAIAAGAQTTDLVAYNSKVAAATAFTAALDTSAEMIGYNGTAANAAAKAWLAGITTDAQLKAAIEPAALNGTVGAVTNPPVVGQTYNLTQGLDTLVGTSANDTFNAFSFNTTTGGDTATLQLADSIDGGAGNDTLNIDIKGALNAELNGSFKNIETININAANATAAVAVDASKFVGATTINQIGKAGVVSKLAVGTTAGFISTGAAALEVNAAGSAASASVNLSGVGEAATLAVGGASLAAVTVSGSRVDTDESGSVAPLALTITAGEDVQSIKVTSNQSTVLTIVDTDSTDKVTAVDASASTGKITFVGDDDVVTIVTGAGGDDVTFAGVTSAATASAAAVNASVSTGAGKDKITVNGSGTGTVTVDAGAGDDTIIVNKVAGLGLNIQGGEGNDTITLNGAALATTDVINGGAGTDTVSVAGKAVRTADDFIVFNKLLTGFETIKFSTAEGATGAGNALDASKLGAGYTTIDLATGSFIAKVGTQALVANGDLTATAAGYGDSSSNPRVGTLNITEKATGTVTANAEIVNLTVTGGVTGTLAGDVKTANVVLTNGLNAAGTVDTIAAVSVSTAATLANVTSLTLTGTGSATVVNDNAGKLTTIDASGLGGTYTVGANAGKAIAGLTLTSTETSAETIKLGAGIDTITLGASKYGSMDTVSGLKLVLNADGTALAASSDKLLVTGATAAVKFTTTQTDLDLALKDAAASTKGDVLVFQMGGDTYVYADNGTVANSVDAGDTIVKLVGTIDLDALILSLGNPVV